MKQIPNLPMESASQRPNRGRDALAPEDYVKSERSALEGILPSDGAQRLSFAQSLSRGEGS